MREKRKGQRERPSESECVDWIDVRASEAARVVVVVEVVDASSRRCLPGPSFPSPHSAAADLRVPVRGPSATHLGLLTFSFDLFPRASCDPRDLFCGCLRAASV